MIYFGLEMDSLCDCSQIVPVFGWVGWGGRAKQTSCSLAQIVEIRIGHHDDKAPFYLLFIANPTRYFKHHFSYLHPCLEQFG